MPPRSAIEDVRRLIQGQVRQLFGAGEGHATPPPEEEPAGDAGLFGPDSACWKVHGDFTSMMIGGVAGLLLQMLHPMALAGVWDHSSFSRDIPGRLRRTAQFIAATTYGSTAAAEAQIARVRAIHDQVHGTLRDGRPYSANDPALLTWVHSAGAACFLEAYLRHRDPQFPREMQGLYFAETAAIAERLGARGVPVTRDGIEAYLERMRPGLRCDYRTREVVRALLSQKGRNPAVASFGRLAAEAAKELLPGWAAEMHGFHPAAARRTAVGLGVVATGAALRWALQDGTEAKARRRAAPS